MALKKPGELFGRKVKEDIPSISVDESFPHIKEEFHKVEAVSYTHLTLPTICSV